MSLRLIYHFQASRNQEGHFQEACYRVVYFFSDEGFLDEKMLREKAMVHPYADSTALSFLSLDELKEFALRVVQEVGEREVRLISVQDYNIGIDGARDLNTFRDIFTKFGDVVLNEEARKKKGGLLGKLFS